MANPIFRKIVVSQQTFVYDYEYEISPIMQMHLCLLIWSPLIL